MHLKFVRTILAALICLFVAGASSPVWAQQSSRFVSVMEDLPLMGGLVEVGEGVQFSTPQGRIVEATAQGSLSSHAVLAFYDRTLPQLGWRRVGQGRFMREEETLQLGFEASGQNLKVRFALTPALP
ncbi:MAG: hypothetical protein JKY92_06845 [Magnetovibrio sp.]|nr:hypothetical protein [Magnetovibrio sp.]